VEGVEHTLVVVDRAFGEDQLVVPAVPDEDLSARGAEAGEVGVVGPDDVVEELLRRAEALFESGVV
jgi:hypothetical protein